MGTAIKKGGEEAGQINCIVVVWPLFDGDHEIWEAMGRTGKFSATMFRERERA